nr:MAG TPA: hypothetical protein [Inoviridae sp.]
MTIFLCRFIIIVLWVEHNICNLIGCNYIRPRFSGSGVACNKYTSCSTHGVYFFYA